MKKRNLLSLIGIFLFIYIIANVDVFKIVNLLSKLKIEYVLLALVLSIPAVLLKALKWKVIIKSYNFDYSLIGASKAWLAGFFISIVTPGRIGDFSRAFYLKKESGFSLGKSLTTVVVDRIIEIALLFLFAFIGLLLIASNFVGAGEILFYFLLFFLLFIVAVLVVSKKSLMRFVFGFVSKRFVPDKYHATFGKIFQDFYEGIGKMSKNKIITAYLIGLMSWIIAIFQAYILSLSLSINLTFTFFFAVIPIISLLDILPISFSGIGTRDAALVFFFATMSVAAETAISFSLLVLALNYLAIGFIGVLIWFRDPIEIG